MVVLYDKLGQTKEIRRPVRIGESPSSIKLEFYDTENGSFVDEWTELDVEVNGKRMTAERKNSNSKNINPNSDYWYEISDLYSYGEHEIEIFTPDNSYSRVKRKVNTENKASSLVRLSSRPESGIISVDAKYSGSDIEVNDYIMANSMALDFEVEMDAGNYKPIEVEFRRSDGEELNYDVEKRNGGGYRIMAERDGSRFRATVNLHNYKAEGYGIEARVVATEHFDSGEFEWHYLPWAETGIKIAPQPSFASGVYYRGNGVYDLHGTVGIGAVKDGLIEGDIPLLNRSNENFGIDTGYLSLDGRLRGDSDTIELSSQKSTNLTSAGYRPRIQKSSMEAAIGYKYDSSSNQWEWEKGEIKVMGGGGFKYTRQYEIPGLSKVAKKLGINVTGYMTLDMRMNAEGTFIVSNGGGYEGIIRFIPNPEVIAGVGHPKLKVEGYSGGIIDSEVHSTGYVRVEPEFYVGARYNAFIFSGNLFHRSTSTVWENSKTKVDSILAGAQPQKLLEVLAMEDNNKSDDFELTPLSRDYLKREPRWLPGEQDSLKETLFAANDLSMAMLGTNSMFAQAQGENPDIDIKKTDIYPESEVQLVQIGDELWMVWIDDNPQRSDMNRTQMMYSVLKDGSWSTPEWMDDDQTADFSPVSASTEDGVLMAWQNLKASMPDDAEIETFTENSEISVTETACQSGSDDMQVTTLTDDDKFDHSPELAADNNNALLTWIKTDQEAAESNDTLMYSSWNEDSWSSPGVITDSLDGSVIDLNLSMHGNEGLLLYTVNTVDGDSGEHSQKIFARVYKEDTWGDDILIADSDENGLSAANPQAVYNNGKWFITWYHGESIMYKEGLGGETKTEEFLKKVEPGYEIELSDGANPQIAPIYQNRNEGNVQNLSSLL